MVQYELIKHNNITWWRGSPSANPSFGDDLTKTQKKNYNDNKLISIIDVERMQISKCNVVFF